MLLFAPGDWITESLRVFRTYISIDYIWISESNVHRYLNSSQVIGPDVQEK